MADAINMELKAGAKIVKIWRLLIYMIYLDNHLISFKDIIFTPFSIVVFSTTFTTGFFSF